MGVLFSELFSEMPTELEAHGEHSGEKEDECGVVRVVVEVSDVKEDESDDEVQEAPEDVDDRRGQSFAGRGGEGSWEWFSGDAFDEVRDGVHEERSGEEAGDVGVPGHGEILAVGKLGYPDRMKEPSCLFRVYPQLLEPFLSYHRELSKLEKPSRVQQLSESFKDEAALRQSLVALLEKMPGISNVRHTHGTDERGKDIVFDAEGPFDQSYLVACVVKNTKITGSVESNHGARTVYNQAEQALQLKFTDSKGVERQVAKVFVITPAECSTSAIESIKDKLQTNGERLTFICGPQLLDLLEKYYPEFFFQSGLFGSYVATLEKELENNQPISTVLFRSGFTAGAPGIAAVYVRPRFFQTLSRFRLLIDFPLIEKLKHPAPEYVVADTQAQLRRLANLVFALLTPDAEAEQLHDELNRFANEIGTNWKEAYEKHRRRRDLSPEEQRAPRGSLSFEMCKPALFSLGEHLISRSQELVEKVGTKVRVASACVDLKFATIESALRSELVKDAIALSTLSQQVPSILAPDGDSVRLDLGSELLDTIEDDLLIVGPAGFGKSSFCRAQALYDFQRLQDGKGRVCPAYVALYQLADGPLESFESSFLINRDLISHWRGLNASQVSDRRFRVYLDGLDEIPSVKRQQEVLALAMTAKESFPKVQFVVTSREHVVGNHLLGLTRIRIREFDDKQIEEFLGKWFGQNHSELSEFKGQLSKVRSLHDLMRVPLLATLILGVYTNLRELPESRVNIYEMFVRLLAGGWDLAKRVNRESLFGSTPKLTVLTRFAALLHIDRRRDGGEADFKAAMKETLPGLVDRWQRLLEELVQDGLLVPAGLNYTFAHLSFQEFLAAKDLFDPNEKGLPMPSSSSCREMTGGKRFRFSTQRYRESRSTWRDL